MPPQPPVLKTAVHNESRRHVVCLNAPMRRAVTMLLLILMPAAHLAAQAEQTSMSDDETDVSDVLRAWRHKEPKVDRDPREKMFVAAPIIGSNPSAGFLLGAAAQMAFFRGDPSTTRLSSGIASLSF